MVTCRRLPKFAGFLLAALSLCEPPSAPGSPQHLVVKAPRRIEYNGRPSCVGFDSKGTSLVIAGDGGIEAWDWRGRRKVWTGKLGPIEQPVMRRFIFDGEHIAHVSDDQTVR